MTWWTAAASAKPATSTDVSQSTPHSSPLDRDKMSGDKQADLAGPGIGTYEDVDNSLPTDYESLLNTKDTQRAIMIAKRYIEEGLCKELNLFRVECPLMLKKDSGMNDNLDRDGSRTPVDFPAGLGISPRLDVQVLQAATKWKRWALKQFGCDVGEGLYTDMRAIRKDYFLDHDHSSYVDQWDWEKVVTPDQRNLDYLKEVVNRIWKVIKGCDTMLRKEFPALNTDKYPPIPDKLKFFHAEEILAMYPDMPRKQRETALAKEHLAVFIVGIGAPLKDGYPHEMRAADYDDWITPTYTKDGEQFCGLNGDIMVWNPVTKRRHELSSMGLRVTKETLVTQLELSQQTHLLESPYHKMIMTDQIPLSIGGGIGQSRLYGYLLHKAALGECSVGVWPEELHKVCEKHNIHLLR